MGQQDIDSEWNDSRCGELWNFMEQYAVPKLKALYEKEKGVDVGVDMNYLTKNFGQSVVKHVRQVEHARVTQQGKAAFATDPATSTEEERAVLADFMMSLLNNKRRTELLKLDQRQQEAACVREQPRFDALWVKDPENHRGAAQKLYSSDPSCVSRGEGLTTADAWRSTLTVQRRSGQTEL